MTDSEKQGVLESFEALYKLVEDQDNGGQFKNNADQLLAGVGEFPLPYIKAAAGELEKVNQAREVKANLLARTKTAIDFIKSTPSEELSHEKIKAQMEKT
ncbi:hypothetical protein [Hymenobacter arizonensis]|uniref:hypothetical protein n=1 Tax=Hymenobacter arizonensis TaxID=1227077 RepID=UPI000A7F2448|nr:hypothetical protein [Hymenobacter arizonensis]